MFTIWWSDQHEQKFITRKSKILILLLNYSDYLEPDLCFTSPCRSSSSSFAIRSLIVRYLQPSFHALLCAPLSCLSVLLPGTGVLHCAVGDLELFEPSKTTWSCQNLPYPLACSIADSSISSVLLLLQLLMAVHCWHLAQNLAMWRF